MPVLGKCWSCGKEYKLEVRWIGGYPRRVAVDPETNETVSGVCSKCKEPLTITVTTEDALQWRDELNTSIKAK